MVVDESHGLHEGKRYLYYLMFVDESHGLHEGGKSIEVRLKNNHTVFKWIRIVLCMIKQRATKLDETR